MMELYIITYIFDAKPSTLMGSDSNVSDIIIHFFYCNVFLISYFSVLRPVIEPVPHLFKLHYDIRVKH